MIDVLNLALPYFGVILIGFICGKSRSIPESGLAWMNFFLLYISLPALFFRLLSKTPFEQLSNVPFILATTSATALAFALCAIGARFFGRTSARESVMAGLSGAYGNLSLIHI